MNGQTSIRVENEEQVAPNVTSCSGRKRPSDPTTQWMRVIYAKVAAEKLKSNTKEKPEVAPASQAPFSDRIQSPPVINDEEGQEGSTAQTKHQEFHAEALKYLMIVHAALVQQLNSYGIVLTLLAAVTSVAILQPPGSFDQGHMLSNGLVTCFLVFSGVSFLLACTGLMAVIIGSAALFRPWFFPEPPSKLQLKRADAQAGVGNSKGTIVYDDIDTLGEIIMDNVLRVRRLRIYLALSLGLCMVAFVCGAFAILGPGKRNLYTAIGTILGGGGLVLVVEIGFILVGPSHPPSWLRTCMKVLRKVGSGRDSLAAMRRTSRRIGEMTKRIKPADTESVRRDSALQSGHVG